jgi:hypothetical protein
MPTRPRIMLPRVDPQRIVAFLQKIVSGHRNRAISLIVFGIPLSFIGPLFFTLIVFAVSARRRGVHLHYWQAFPWVCLVTLPLLYLLAWSAKGSIFEKNDSFTDYDELPGFSIRGRAAAGMMFLEIANIGPRMVLYGTKQLRGQSSSQVDLNRAAKAVAALMMSEDGIPPAQLLLEGEPAQNLEPILAFLMFYDLADISKDGDRVWLQTAARKKLDAAVKSA